MSGEDILADIEKTKKEISILDEERRRLAIRVQTLKGKLDELNAKYNLLKTKEASKLDWTTKDFSWNDKIQDLLRNKFHLEVFRHQQLAAINAILSKKDVILLMPTGGGKSLCYQLPALITNGITLVISPLISLIDDQILALKHLGIDAATVNSSNSKTEGKRVFDALSFGNSSIKLIYVTPEWMSKSKRFMTNLQKCYSRKELDRIAIDEVHCCSQWGHDFRPDYKFLGILKNTFRHVPIIGLTATATEDIIVDCQAMLNIQGSIVLKAPYNRPNLYYAVKPKPSSQENFVDMLADLILNKYEKQSGIIYTLSINDSVDLAKDLKARRVSVACYHANMDLELRQKVHEKWLSNHYQVVVATVAFGMGIDKSNVRFVIHHSLPKSMENFYQESGRAGRDNKRADCILFYNLKDIFRISSLICTTSNGTKNLYKLVKYCLEAKRCRRSLIAAHFQEVWDETQCNKMCDNCKYPNCYETKDITKYYYDICSITEYASKSDTRLTAIKIIEAWLQSGGSKLIRPPDLQKPLISRIFAENVLAFLLVHKYLQEDIRFTPYCTISYISKGFVKVCDKITMDVARTTPHEKQETKPKKSQNTRKRKLSSSDSE